MNPKQQLLLVQRHVAQEMRKNADVIKIQTAQQMYAVVLAVLHDKWDFTAEQLVKVFDQIVSQFDCLNGKYVKIEEFYELLGEMGIKVKGGGEKE